MSKNKETFTITAALPYANGPIHIGHLAGVYIPADISLDTKDLQIMMLHSFVEVMNMGLQFLSI